FVTAVPDPPSMRQMVLKGTPDSADKCFRDHFLSLRNSFIFLRNGCCMYSSDRYRRRWFQNVVAGTVVRLHVQNPCGHSESLTPVIKGGKLPAAGLSYRRAPVIQSLIRCC